MSRGVNNNIPAEIPVLPRQPLQSDEMSPDEDALLLLLIYEHLKVRGHAKAAEVLEDHVKQVRTFVPKCSFNALIGARDAEFLLASIKIEAHFKTPCFAFCYIREPINYRCVFAPILLQPPCVRACVRVLRHMVGASCSKRTSCFRSCRLVKRASTPPR